MKKSVVTYGTSTHLRVSCILKCGYINQICFSLHEAMITPPSQSSSIDLKLLQFIYYLHSSFGSKVFFVQFPWSHS